jgi:hypothetical protein
MLTCARERGQGKVKLGFLKPSPSGRGLGEGLDEEKKVFSFFVNESTQDRGYETQASLQGRL